MGCSSAVILSDEWNLLIVVLNYVLKIIFRIQCGLISKNILNQMSPWNLIILIYYL